MFTENGPRSVTGSVPFGAQIHQGIDLVFEEERPIQQLEKENAEVAPTMKRENTFVREREQQIDRRRFDALIEMLVEDGEPFVVMDNGQASFAPLTRYMVECEAFDILRQAGRECFVHTVIAGGQLGSSTLRGLSDTLTAFGGNANVAVWHNDHFGPVDQAGYEQVVGRAETPVIGPIQLHLWSKPFEDDVQDMLRNFLTFEEALRSATLASIIC